MAFLAAGGRPRLVSLTVEVEPADPLRLFAAGSKLRHYWERPFDDFALAGIGGAWKASTYRLADRSRCRAELRELARDAVVLSPCEAGPAPLLFGAVPFTERDTADEVWSGFEVASLVLPEVLLARHADRSWLTINQTVSSEKDLDALEKRAAGATGHLPVAPPSPRDVYQTSFAERPGTAGWTCMVEDATATIASGALQKVVVARRDDRCFSNHLDAAVLLDRLRAAYGETSVFAIGNGRHTFLGASPERLAQVRGGSVLVSCVAGSSPRGQDERSDCDLADWLRHDRKNRSEYDAVVAFVARKLAPLCDRVQIDPEPSVMTVRNIHHLSSEAVGSLRPGNSILDVVEALHPTPAVAGAPVKAALDFIHAHEPFTRGLFAAPIGWLNLHGEGDFAVAIRSGVIHETRAHLFAGCGIVAGSKPEDEWRETEVKLLPMLSALGIS